MSNISDFILGSLLLLAGRKLFWLAVGIIGFVAGFNLAGQVLAPGGEPNALPAGILFGIVGAALAVAFEWAAVLIVVGFLGGGYLLVEMLAAGQWHWPLYILGGIIGMAAVALTFDLALIVISSLLGATLIVAHLNVDPAGRVAILAGSAVAGVLLQYWSARVQDPEREN